MRTAWAFLCVMGLVASPAMAGGRVFVDVTEVPADLREGGRPVAVLDTRGLLDFAVGHIPGAQRFAWTDTARPGLREGRLAEPVTLSKRFAEAGVDRARPVLVCGAGPAGWGEEGRVAWALITLGHPRVRVLDGGCDAWEKAGRDIERGPPRSVAPGAFAPKVSPQSWVTKEQVHQRVKDKAARLIDVRERKEYDGATPYFSARGGHIPGAGHLHVNALWGTDGKVLRGAALDTLLQQHGIGKDRPVVSYCTGGVRSAFFTLVLRDAGYDAANYAGSWWEWSADDKMPVQPPQ